jgi:hypothetical protein
MQFADWRGQDATSYEQISEWHADFNADRNEGLTQHPDFIQIKKHIVGP